MQQVNLLTDDLKPTPMLLSLGQALLVWCGIGGILGALSLFDAVSLWRTNVERAALEEQLQELREVTAELESSSTPRLKHELTRLVDRLRTSYDERRSAFRMLELGASFPREGFARHLEDLAANPIDGLWLTRIELGDGGRSVQLTGHALAAARVPDFLQALGTETAFDGVRFSEFSLKNPEAGPLEFVITPQESEG